MASGKGRDNEKNMTFGKSWDSKKMLYLYIYDHMKGKGLHDAADIFAKEANLEMFKILDSDKGLLKEWWELFWPQFSSRLANKIGENSRSFEKPSMQDVLAILASQGATSSQHAPVGNPEFVVVPTHMTNQQMIASGGSAGLNGIEQPPVSLANEAGGNSQSFEQPCMQDVLDILASLEKQGATSFQHTPVGSTQQNVVPTPMTNQQMIDSGGSAGVNVVEQPPASWLQTPHVISQRKAGKRPVNTDSDSILRKSPAPSSHPSILHLPVTMQSPVQVTGGTSNNTVAERSDQMDSNRLGQNSTSSPPGLQADLSEFLSDFLKE